MGAVSFSRDDYERAAATLLEVAGLAVVQAVREGKVPPPGTLPVEPPLQQPSGVFVTLRRRGRLRGCIGYPLPLYPMAEACWRAAQQAALEDPRFLPVTEEELEGLTVEVSILTPGKEFTELSEWRPGVDGVMLEAEGRRALYLPEVAAETGWEGERFLTELSLKAGLDPDAWKQPGTRLLRFQTVTSEGIVSEA
ncbi:MAG: AmmeMemoRadiSam system protein A [bacterium]